MTNMSPTVAPLPIDNLPRRATLVDPDESGLTHLAIGPGTYTILLRGSDTGGSDALIDMLVPANGVLPAHCNDFEEMFHVHDGELEVIFWGKTMRLKAGQSLNIPANALHGFRVPSATAARFLCLCVGLGQEEFFEAVGDRLLSRTSPAPARSSEEARAKRALGLSLVARFWSEFLPPPRRALHQDDTASFWRLAVSSGPPVGKIASVVPTSAPVMQTSCLRSPDRPRLRCAGL